MFRGSLEAAHRRRAASASRLACRIAAGAGVVTIRVLLVDDQELVRTGFRMILDGEDDIEVVGEAANGREAVDAVGDCVRTSS